MQGYAVAQLIGATSQKIAGSIPADAIQIFYWLNPCGRPMALGFTQPITEMITRNISSAPTGTEESHGARKKTKALAPSKAKISNVAPLSASPPRPGQGMRPKLPLSHLINMRAKDDPMSFPGPTAWQCPSRAARRPVYLLKWLSQVWEPRANRVLESSLHFLLRICRRMPRW